MENLTQTDLPIFIIGAGPFAEELSTYLIPFSKQISFVTDDPPKHLLCVTTAEYRQRAAQGLSYLGSGKCDVKIRMVEEIAGPVGPPVMMGTFLGAQSQIEKGSIIAPGAVISAFNEIGSHVLINYQASIGHHTKIDDYAVIAPNASIGGKCVIEKGAYIGAGANVRENIRIGENAIVGMGAVVTKDVKPYEVVIGCPATQTERKGGW